MSIFFFYILFMVAFALQQQSSIVEKGCMGHKAENIYYLTPYRKSANSHFRTLYVSLEV